ncbi:MAG: hypothetical protein OEN50_21095 [Deltaproteobacteria bacterium]|nr:hypothetical protein [Deltaproteobacteria bacterium]
MAAVLEKFCHGNSARSSNIRAGSHHIEKSHDSFNATNKLRNALQGAETNFIGLTMVLPNEARPRVQDQ